MNVMMIGFSGVGKTSYMGAMYGQWNNESSDSFSVMAQSKSQHLNLLSLARQLKRGRYPSSTDMLDRYEFTLSYRGQPILDFSWIDYRGGVLAERGSSELQSVVRAINESHALIVFLDMPRFVTDPRGTCSIIKRLSILLQNALSEVQKRCEFRYPVSVVLTKADAVDVDAFVRSSGWEMLRDLFSRLRENEHVSLMHTITEITDKSVCGVQYPFVHSVVWGLLEFRASLHCALAKMGRKERRLRAEGGLLDDIRSIIFGEKSKNEMADEELARMQELVNFVDSLQEPLKEMGDYLVGEAEDENKLVWL